jgi:HAD-hyrolase-like
MRRHFAAIPRKCVRCQVRGIDGLLAAGCSATRHCDERIQGKCNANSAGARVGPNVPVITRDQVAHAKPDPDLFLAAAERLRVPIEHSVVVGDSIWDLLAARRARALGVGLLSGGYGEEELQRAGAYCVYQDPADLLAHLDEMGVREP